MKRIIFILITLLLTVQYTFAEETTSRVLKGSVVECEAEEEALPLYLDEINLNSSNSFKFKSDLIKKPKTFEMKAEDNFNIYAKQGSFSLQSNSKKGIADIYFKDNLKQTTELKYEKKYFELSSGYQTKYQSIDATKASQNLFFNQKIKAGKRFSIEFDNSINPRNRQFSQEVGLNYRAKYLKGANFGVSGGTTYSENSVPTQKMHFTTDFYFK